MLKPLIKIAIASVFSNFSQKNGNEKNRKGKKLLYGILICYLVFAVMFLSATVFISVAPSFIENGVSWLYFALVAVMVTILTVFGSFSIAQSLIYKSKDNSLLLSMPIKVSDILFSRAFVLLLFNYLYSLFVFLPAGIVYAVCSQFTFFGIAAYIFLSLLLPLLTMTVSLVFAWVITLITNKLKQKNIFSVFFTITFLLGYMYFSFNLQNVISSIILNTQQISVTVKRYLGLFYCYGTAITEGNILSLIIFVLACIIPFVLALYLLSRTFLKFVTGSKVNQSNTKKSISSKRNSHLISLVKKEFERLISLPTYIMNVSIGGILSVIIALMLLINGDEMLLKFGFPVDMQELMPIFVATVFSFFVGMNCSTVASISLEGSSILFLKSLPLNFRDFYNAKLLVNFSYGIPLTFIASLIASFSFKGSFADSLIIILFPLSLQIFAAVAGLVINMHKPQFNWTNPVYPVKQSTNVLLEIVLAVLLSVAPLLVYMIAFSNLVSYAAYYFSVIAIILLICLMLYIHIMKSGNKYFEKMS